MMLENSPFPLLDRARDFTLASLVVEYPSEELVETLKDLGHSLDSHALAALAAAGAAELRPLQVRYARIFEEGQQRVSLYETEHGPLRGANKGNDLADIAGFYRAFSLDLNDTDVHEMLDHVAVELEFYGQLLLKQHLLSEQGDEEGCAIVQDARGKFLESHLGRFVSVIAEQGAVQADAVYGPALSWCARLVQEECAELGVRPPPLQFFPDQGERDDPSCGAVRLPVLN